MDQNMKDREQGDINTSPMREKYIAGNVKGRALDIYNRDKAVFLHQNLSTPVLTVIDRAEGAWLYDVDGKKYLDMHGNGVHNAGFNNDYIVKKMIQALEDKKTFTPRRYTNEAAVELAEKLVEVSPDGLDRVLFAPGGSEAIEMAITLAKHITGKWKTLSFWDSFHGVGFQASSVGGERLFKKGRGPLVPGALHVEFPNYDRNPWGFREEKQVDDEILRNMEMLFEKEGEIACVIGEPISATPVVPSTYFWSEVKKMCEKHGALLIFDEVIEGFGRTGELFACQHFLTPDILVMGKSLGGGILPFAGILTRDEFNVLQDCSIGHFTHEKNGLCAVAGLGEIEYILEHKLVENSRNLGNHIMGRFEALKEKHPMIGAVAGKGLHIGVDIVKNRETMERAPLEAESMMYMCMEKGLAFKLIEGNIVTLRPSLLITLEEADFIVDTIVEALERVERGESY